VTFSPGNPASACAPSSTLMPGTIPAFLQQVDEQADRPLVFCRIVSSNKIAPLIDFAEAGRGHDQFAPGAARFLGLRNAERGEALVAGRNAFVHGEQAAVAVEHGFYGGERMSECS